MSDRYLSVRDFATVCLQLLRQEKSLMVIILTYGVIASAFNLLLPLSIQYIASQISANASVFPVVTIILCLVAFLIFYGVLKVIQVIAFAYFEKRFFMRTVALMALSTIALVYFFGILFNLAPISFFFLFLSSVPVKS